MLKYVGINHAIGLLKWNWYGSNAAAYETLFQKKSCLDTVKHHVWRLDYGKCSWIEIKGVIDCDIFLVPTLEMVRTEVEKISSTNYGKLILLLSHIGGIINPWMKKSLKP